MGQRLHVVTKAVTKVCCLGVSGQVADTSGPTTSCNSTCQNFRDVYSTSLKPQVLPEGRHELQDVECMKG